MNRALPLALAVVGLAVVLSAVFLLRPADDGATREDRVRTLAAGLRCPDCQGLSVADSPTTAAVEIRRQIGAQVDAGRSDDDVRRHFVERYGDWILLTPRSPLAWWLPVAFLAAGVAALILWLRGSGRTRRAADPPASVTPAERLAVREEAEGLDA